MTIEQIEKINLKKKYYSSRKNEKVGDKILELTLTDIFPEIKNIVIDYKGIKNKIQIPEKKIQDEFRSAFREIGGNPIPFRGKDGPLEVADIEHFQVKLGNRQRSFTIVVKGYDSISGKLKWQDVAHQITKANRTHPHYILVITAREPVDSVITEMITYSNDVGSPNLIIFVCPWILQNFLSGVLKNNFFHVFSSYI